MNAIFKPGSESTGPLALAPAMIHLSRSLMLICTYRPDYMGGYSTEIVQTPARTKKQFVHTDTSTPVLLKQQPPRPNTAVHRVAMVPLYTPLRLAMDLPIRPPCPFPIALQSPVSCWGRSRLGLVRAGHHHNAERHLPRAALCLLTYFLAHPIPASHDLAPANGVLAAPGTGRAPPIPGELP